MSSFWQCRRLRPTCISEILKHTSGKRDLRKAGHAKVIKKIKKLPKLTPLRDCEREALAEIIPLAEDYAMHGDLRASVVLEWARGILGEGK
jgi:hypothetical protein